MITILNTSIITSHGSYTYKPCSLEQAKRLVADGFVSAIGHESTAAVISTLLDVKVEMNRIQYKQQPGDIALVFKLKGRAPEGKVLTAEEIEEIGHEWGALKRTDNVAADHTHKQYGPKLSIRAWWWIRNKYWWVTDHIVLPVFFILFVIGLAVSISSGLEKIFLALF